MAALVLAGLLFGSTFLVVQGAIEGAGVMSFLAVRFVVGAAVLWPMARRRRETPGERRDGLLAGLALVGGFVFQTAGLRSTDSANSAFITYLLVVFVPVIGLVRFRRRPPWNVMAGVVLAVGGLYALSGGLSGVGRGELLTLASAFFFALHIVVLGEVAHRHDPIRLTMWQALTVGVFCLVPGAFSPGGYGFDGSVWLAAIYCGVGPTAIAFWCQSWAQRVVPETQAALILLLEPVSAGVLGVATGEALGLVGLVGAACILGAVVLAEFVGREKPMAIGGELATVADAPALFESG